MIDDRTIAAIVTPRGTGGICVLRICGSDALSIGNKLFLDKKALGEQRNWSAQYGKFIHPITQQHIDECVCLVMHGPKSYTGDDTVEYNLHGGSRLAEIALQAAVTAGATLAGPGEFSKRALLNGRMDLTQVEAVAELISAGSERESQIALKKLEGGLGVKLDTVRNIFLDILMKIEAGFDFSEEDVQFLVPENAIPSLMAAKETCVALAESYRSGCIIHNGISVGLFGCVNVGKSSLLNAVLQEDRAIVTEHPGTTRDTVHGEIERQGIRFRFIDTAGIRNGVDAVESIGVDKSHQLITDVDIAVLILDAGAGYREKDARIVSVLLKERAEKQHIVICINKTDLSDSASQDALVCSVSSLSLPVVQTSAKENDGIGELVETIEKITLNSDGLCKTHDLTITSLRQKEILDDIVQQSDHVIQCIRSNIANEFLADDIRTILTGIDTMLGKDATEEVLDMIFSNFCIGK